MAEEKKQKTDYSKSVIYTIETKDGLYVGSTSNFKDRKTKHKNNINNKNSEKYNFKVYKNIRKNGGEWDMKILKQFPCDNRPQLEAEEQLCCDELNPNLNGYRCMGTDIKKNQKKWRDNNKEKYKEKYYSKKKEKITCECGAVVCRTNLSHHKKSAKHIDYLTENP